MSSTQEFTTPMMLQYLEIKRQYADCLLFFRLGDFYELFLEDAKIGAKVLGITLTARPRGKDGDIPMAGVPYHSANSYIAKLVKAGYKIAICEQVSQPNNKTIVERQVVRIITPGTITDEAVLDHKTNNFLICMSTSKHRLGITLSELTTGEIYIDEWPIDQAREQLGAIGARYQPAEVLYSPNIDPRLLEYSQQTATHYALHQWNQHIKRYKKSLLSRYPLNPLLHQPHLQLALKTLQATLQYLEQTQKQNLEHFHELTLLSNRHRVALDASTLANLEVFVTLRDRQVQGSLLAVLDCTQTAMGGRLLKHWLAQPLTAIDDINQRLDVVELFSQHDGLRCQLAQTLKEVTDIERLVTRLHLNQGGPRDLLRLSHTLLNLGKIKSLISNVNQPLLLSLKNQISEDIQNLVITITSTLKEQVPTDPKEGNFIKTGINKTLDTLRGTITASQQWMLKTEQIQKDRTGISSLKIKFNKVFGYYIEISKANLNAVPTDYERKQTLVNAERFTTPQLKHHESVILSNEIKAQQLEHQLYRHLVDKILAITKQLQQAAQAVATLDCLVSMATVAVANNYTRPKINDTGELELVDSRHPVVEQLLKDQLFVPNNVTLNHTDHQLLVLTGPNMAGKSVFMRQVALVTLMAHVGSFVPSSQANICLVDRIFVRSGAADVITQGLSTFMVEMVETAHILAKATPKSLIIMDEIGRGTSTYDGISIAWAIAEYLTHSIGAKTLFATHYHELQNLETEHPKKIKNYHAAVEMHQSEPVFIHRILPGAATHSYGIAVAKRAGVPQQVAQQARKILATLENTVNISRADNKIEALHVNDIFPNQLTDQLIKHLTQIDISTTTPLEALNILSQLKGYINTNS